jgi:hypothetical protein
MKKALTLSLSFAAASGFASGSLVFITPNTVFTNASDFFPAANLIQGPGVGFQDSEPYDRLSGGADGTWVTNDPGGFPSDYIAVAGPVVITLDLGSDVTLGQIHTWGYSDTNANGVSVFSLRFATDADGPGGFGTSISYNPTFSMTVDQTPMQTNPFDRFVDARYVEFTTDDNYFVAPGNGSTGGLAGGDRVGLGEISFTSVPEPTTGLLAFAGLALLARRRR